MSAISGFINTIKNAVYGEQVRTAIVNALEACYSDVNAPSLQTEAFETALNEAYAGGILDIQTVTQISAMTNQAIIYRYNGTEAGKQKGLYYYSALSSSWVLIGSEIHAVSLIAQMTDTNAIYKYTGTQSGMVQNSLYCYNGTAWVPIGSGVLTASTAAGMTNTGAIYKYTGNETGYISNALYYYNGTDWTPLADLRTTEEMVADLQAEINDLQNSTLTSAIKQALLACFQKVAYIDADGAIAYSTLESLLSTSETLPSAYQEVDYIRAVGYAAINTGIHLDTSKNVKITSKFESLKLSTSVAAQFYGIGETPDFSKMVAYSVVNSANNNERIRSAYYPTATDTFLTYEPGGNVGVANIVDILSTTAPRRSFTVNGVTATNNYIGTYNLTEDPLFLFAAFADSRANNDAKFYGMTVENGGITVAKLVPCYRKSDNVVGVYDMINRAFMTKVSGSTGTLTKGADVES